MRYSDIYKERLTQALSNNSMQRLTQALPNNNIQRETENQTVFIPNSININEDDYIPRETLNSVYGDNYDIIKTNLGEIEKETMNYFSIILNDLNNKYKEFNTNINLHFKDVTFKITDAFKLNNPTENTKNIQRNSLIQKYSNEYIQQLNKVIEMHDEIFKNIKDSIKIFFNFLDISKILNKEKPIQEFLSTEFSNIIQNWLFLKINIEDFDFAKAINEAPIDINFKKFISKICKDKNFIMDISLPKNYMIKYKKNYGELNDIKNKINNMMENNKKVMSDNHSNLVKLKMSNIFFVDQFFDEKIMYEKMRYLKLDNVLFDESKRENNFFQNIPNLEKLIINRSNNFEINKLKYLSDSLIKLSLSNNGFVDFEFNEIMTKYLVSSESIRKKLQILSFSNNNLSYVDISQIVYQPKQSFYALKELDFQRNKIHYFNISPEFFVELKCINCCSNCFTKSYFDSYKNILTLLSGNTFLTTFNLAQNYFSSLKKKLTDFTISLSYLNLSYIPKILSNEYLSNLIINESILINLKKLDLSHNNINCDTIFNFFEHNKGCLSLKLLNLSYNLLDDSFFEKYLNLKLYNIFTKLKFINLDSNKFGYYNRNNNNSYNMRDIMFQKNYEKDINNIKLLYRFISENKSLVELTMTKNPISRKLLIKSIEENAENFSLNDYLKKDENDEISINCFYSFLWKIKIDLIKKKSNGESREENELRSFFNIKFDCDNRFNNYIEDFDFNKSYIIFK